MKSFLSLFFILTLSVASCGGGGDNNSNTGSAPDDANEGENQQPEPSNPDVNSINKAAFGQKVTMSFDIEIETESANNPDLNFNFDISGRKQLDLYIQDDGTVTVFNQDFPKLVKRLLVCDENNASPRCDANVDVVQNNEEFEVDITLDACDPFVNNRRCGPNDESRVTGTLQENGDFILRNLPIRVRVFSVSPSSNGNTASPTSTGLAALPRITIFSLTTGLASNVAFFERGADFSSPNPSLVAAGIIPAGLEPLTGASYFTRLSNISFDIDPLSIIQ